MYEIIMNDDVMYRWWSSHSIGIHGLQPTTHMRREERTLVQVLIFWASSTRKTPLQISLMYVTYISLLTLQWKEKIYYIINYFTPLWNKKALYIKSKDSRNQIKGGVSKFLHILIHWPIILFRINDTSL